MIHEFHVIELPTPLHAEAVANFLSHYIATVYQRGRVHGDGAGRPVIWAGSPLAATGMLYLSPGAVEAARAAGLNIDPARCVSARELPAHRTLLLGTPEDRTQSGKP